MTGNRFFALACLALLAPVAFATTDPTGAAHARAAQRAARQAEKRAKEHAMNAQKMLELSMRQLRALNVIAIVTKCNGDLDAVSQRLKLEQKAMGEQMRMVLQPLSMQGVTYVEDGKKSLMYLPDQRVVFECDSDLEGIEDIAQRAELAAKNYELRCDTMGSQIAGRATVCVVAMPKIKGLPARQFYLDEQTFYPLRFALADADGQWKVSMDTQMVDFPKAMPARLDFQPAGCARRVKFDPAQPLSGVKNVKGRLGFEPIQPKHLPFGFQIQRSELRQNEDGNLAMLWLTDGLATARVYELRCNQMPEGIWSQGSYTVLTQDGVTLFLVSDLAQNIRQNLLSAFAHRQPLAIPPPAPSQSSNCGIKPPPLPSEEPNGPRPMFSPIQPGSGTSEAPAPPPASDANADGQLNNV